MTINNEHIRSLSGVSDEFLVECAKKAMENSYSIYSGFRVGAALMTDNNKVFVGCNIENSSFGATICAERTAIVKAVSEGEKRIARIAIVSATGKQTPPCGICLQVLREFMDDDGVVILADNEGVHRYLFRDVYPMSFAMKDFDLEEE